MKKEMSFVLLNIFMYEVVSFHFEWKNNPFGISYKSNATVENSPQLLFIWEKAPYLLHR